MKINVYTYHVDDGWRVGIEGVHKTQKQAETVARYVSRCVHGEVKFRDLLGRFLRRDSHGNDPASRPG
jgi:hypothetical protein